MTTGERRLDALTTGLTARERALVGIRGWMRGEERDERLEKYMPPDQKREYDGILAAVQQANQSVEHLVAVWHEWLTHVEMLLGWLECLDAFLRREAQVAEALKSHGLKLVEASRGRTSRVIQVDPLPPPQRGHKRSLPTLMGTPGDDPDLPGDWPGMRELLAKAVREGIQVRWRELAALEIALLEFGEELGEDATHPENRSNLDRLRDTILAFYSALLPLTTPFELPEPGEEQLKVMRENIDPAALRSSKAAALPHDPRKWMRDEERAALDDLERQWAEQVRSGPN